MTSINNNDKNLFAQLQASRAEKSKHNHSDNLASNPETATTEVVTEATTTAVEGSAMDALGTMGQVMLNRSNTSGLSPWQQVLAEAGITPSKISADRVKDISTTARHVHGLCNGVFDDSTLTAMRHKSIIANLANADPATVASVASSVSELTAAYPTDEFPIYNA